MPAHLARRERVRMALGHRQPDRVPFSWGFGPTREMTQCLRDWLRPQGIDFDRLRAATADTLRVDFPYIGPPQEPWTDIWGIRRQRQSYGTGEYNEIAHHPLAGVSRVDEIDAHPWPSPDWFDYDALSGMIQRAEAEFPGKAIVAGGGNPFEIYCWMTGLEEALLNLITQPEVVVRALERITEFFLGRLERTARVLGDRVDLWFFADDLGGQNGLLMSRETYRDILQPFHRRLYAASKRVTPDSFALHHSDGSVFDLLPDLIDAGLDALEAVQTDCAKMSPEGLKAAYGDRLGFHGGISVQQLLPRADAATVARECRRLVEVFGRGGGYIAAPSHAIQMGTPPENVMAMLRAVLGDADLSEAVSAAQTVA